MKRRQPRRWAWALLGFLIGSPCLALPGYMIWVKLSFARDRELLPARIAAARQIGLRLEPAELRAAISAGQGENAANDYRRAFIALDALHWSSDVKRNLRSFGFGTLTTKQEAEAERALADSDEVVELFKAASRLPKVDWNRKWEADFDLEYSETDNLKIGASILCAKASLAAQGGDIHRAFDLLRAAARIGGHASQDPDVMGYLVDSNIQVLTITRAGKILSRGADRNGLREARVFLNTLPPPPDAASAFEGELIKNRAAIHDLVQIAETSRGTDSAMFSDPFANALIKDPGVRDAIDSRVIDYWCQAYRIVRNAPDWSARRPALEALGDRFDRDDSWTARLGFIFTPEFANTPESEARAIAYRNMFATAIAVLERRLTGKNDLPPADRDPFADKALGCKLSKTGFKVYSVGPDGIDDAGLTWAEDRSGSSKTHDLAMSFAWPKFLRAPARELPKIGRSRR